jgi:hypothetical protein
LVAHNEKQSKKHPPPAAWASPKGKKKSKGQNCSVPLRCTTQFSQLINSALFCAEFFRSIKPHRTGGTKKPGSAIPLHQPQKENTANTPKKHIPQRRKCRRGFNNQPQTETGLFSPAVFGNIKRHW